MSKISRFWLEIALLSIFIQQVIVLKTISPVKLYMLFVLAFCFVLVFFKNKIKIKYMMDFEVLWVFFLMGNMLTFWYADNLSSSLSLFFGCILLLFTFYSYRTLFQSFDKKILAETMLRFYYYFLLVSLVFYAFGMYVFFVRGEQPDGDGYAARSLYGVLFEGSSPRLRGISDSPNNFGLFTIIGYSIFLFLENNKVKKIAFGTMFLLASALSMSITLIIAIATITIAYLIKSRTATIKTVILLVLFFILLLSNDYVYNLLANRLDHLSTGSGRYHLWSVSLDAIAEKPFFGYGINQARELLTDVRGYKTTHNAFLNVWMEGGIVLLMIHFFMWIGIFFRTFKSYVRSEMSSFLFPLSIGMFIFSMSNVTIYTEVFTLYLVVCSSFLIKSNGAKVEKDKYVWRISHRNNAKL